MSSPTPKKSSEFQVEKQDILQSRTTSYQVVDFNGEGCFGKVAKCLDLNTSEMVAIKIHKDNEDDVIKREVAMLEAVRPLDPDKKNIVRFMDYFRSHDLSCLAFEMLDMSLWDLIKKRNWQPLSLSEIRPITHQLLVALDALKRIGIMHTDLKPDNVMLVNHKDQPFKIKLIDFGLALPTSEVELGMMMQANSYRAPEVTLGLPLSEAIDMWGVGCIMAFLYFGMNLFPCNCPYHWMKTMVHLVGMPDNHHILSAKFSWVYFIWDHYEGWRLRTPEEYEEVTGVKPEVYKRCLDSARNLKDAVMRNAPKEDDLSYEDRRAFLDLLRCCLYPDHEMRITPSEALKHNFVTMVHLVDKTRASSSYTAAAIQLMSVSPLENSDQPDDDNESWFHRKDSSTCSGYDGDDEKFSGESVESQSESDTVSNGSCCSSSNSSSYDVRSCGNNADIESLSNESVTRGSRCRRRAKKQRRRRHRPVKHCYDDFNIHFNNNADSKNSWESVNSHPHDKDPSPSRPTSEVDLQANKPPGASAVASVNDGVRETTTPPKEEPATSATHNNHHTNADHSPVASNNNKDSSSADVVQTDGATASVLSNDEGAASINAVNVDDIKTGARRKNVFQRINRFFGRVKKRVVSIFTKG